uniref:Ig-like domain-containing protein n=1 Tax=Takifugu rubripes TaxID=31033 RepID=H2U4A8_TAKRU
PEVLSYPWPDGQPAARVSFTPSPPNLNSPSIQITDVRMSDEGKYICEYATYPSGNEQGITYLPQNSASIVTVKWVTTANGNDTTVEYHMIPKPEDTGKDISCVYFLAVNTLNVFLVVILFIAIFVCRSDRCPRVTIVGYDNNWYLGRTNVVLTCQATANPIPLSVDWKTMSGELPDTVVITGNELKVLKVDEAVNTTFVCEVRNRIGTSKDQVTVLVRGEL